MHASRISILTVLRALIALTACRRKEAVYQPLKLGGLAVAQPVR